MNIARLKYKPIVFLMLVWAGFFLTGCSVDRRVSAKVNRVFKHSQILNGHHVGFALYDLSARKMVFGKNADKYFTPASNTKLFTFYAGLKLIPDSVPALRFIERGDSLIFWGTGDPSFLHPGLKNVKALDFLRKSNKKLFFAPGRYTGGFYGRGWPWDDYNDYYQAEINELPVFGNLVDINAANGKIQVSPKAFTNCFFADSLSKDSVFKVVRKFDKNEFEYPAISIPDLYSQQVPYKVSLSNTLTLLADTLDKAIGIVEMKMPLNAKTLYGLKTDSVLKAMMLPSDNFIAEQLMLVYGNEIGADMNTERTINYIVKNYLADLPDEPQWVDGSGLSRYDLFTPRDIAKLLELIYNEINNPKRLYGMLPAGGKAGTLKNTYPKTNDPFVFGKTGTLSNNHNQSGYVITKKKRLYIFSFMNNNFVLPTSAIRKEMVRVVTYIHDNF